MEPDGANIAVTVSSITDENGNVMDSAPHPKQKVYFKLTDENGNQIRTGRYSILRRQEE